MILMKRTRIKDKMHIVCLVILVVPVTVPKLVQVTKLVELYKESSDEWSKKAGELEGVIKALEVRLLSQVVVI